MKTEGNVKIPLCLCRVLLRTLGIFLFGKFLTSTASRICVIIMYRNTFIVEKILLIISVVEMRVVKWINLMQIKSKDLEKQAE